MRITRFLVFLLLLFSIAASAVERIVSIGGDVTEIVFGLGAGQQVVARDSTSRYPAAVLKLPDIGYMRQLHAESILSMRPTLLLTSELAQPALALDRVRKVNIPVEVITGEGSLDAVPRKIQQIARILKREKEGKLLTEKYEKALLEVRKTPLNTKVLFIMNNTGMTPMVAGQNTAADAIITAAGAKNAAQGFSNYRPLSQEGVIASAPDLVLLSSDGAAALGGADRVWSLPGLALTPAAKSKNLLVLDTMGLLGFGLTTPEALAQLRRAMELAQP